MLAVLLSCASVRSEIVVILPVFGAIQSLDSASHESRLAKALSEAAISSSQTRSALDESQGNIEPETMSGLLPAEDTGINPQESADAWVEI